MFDLLSLATQKGGFDNLSAKEKLSLNKYTGIVKEYEDANFTIPMPQTVQVENPRKLTPLRHFKHRSFQNYWAFLPFN